MSAEGQFDQKALVAEVATLLRRPPTLLYVLLILIFVLVLVAGYLVIHDRFSESGRNLAETQHLMAQANRETINAVATTPLLIKSISELIRDNVDSRFGDLTRQLPARIQESLEMKVASISNSVSAADQAARQIDEARTDVLRNAGEIARRLEESRSLYSKLESILPAYELWKSVADPEYLQFEITNRDKFDDDAKAIIRQFQTLVEDSITHPERVPAKYIELVGDWCRRKNQFGLALWFYEKAVERDSERSSAEVELLALRAEYVAGLRDASLEKLGHIAEKENSERTLKRIFDAFIETDRYDALVALTTRLLDMPATAGDPRVRALILKNRSVGRRGNGHNVSQEDQNDLEAAVQLVPSDENVLRSYAFLQRDAGKRIKEIEIWKRLIEIDHTDPLYYRRLSEAYAAVSNYEAALQSFGMGIEFATSLSEKSEYYELKRRLNRPLDAAEEPIKRAIRALPDR